MRSAAAAIGIGLSALLAVVLLRPLWPEFTSAIPGRLGDNVAFVWNTWWAAHRDGRFPALFFSSRLFAPFGADLTLHTHTVLASTIVAALPTGVIAQTNALVAVHLLLNAICAYALAFHVTKRPAASGVAAIAFAWSPFVGMHLAGHYNLVAAWMLPLFALLLLTAVESGGATAGLLGAFTGAIAYIDYYYFVYAIALGLVILASRSVSLSTTADRLGRPARAGLAFCAALLLLDLAVIAAIAAGRGGTFHLGRLALSVRGIENPAAAAGILAIVIGVIVVLPRLRLHTDRTRLTGDVGRLAIAALTVAVVLGPLIAASAALWRHGGYVSQPYFWRSAPAGVDLGTLLAGNPHGALWRSFTPVVYERLAIDGIEQTAWLGPALLVLAGVAMGARRSDARVRLWFVAAALFGVWALGPRLQVFGRDLHLFLPAVLLRYVPVAANARMPGRAMVVVYLAVSMLAAIGFDLLQQHKRRFLAWTLAALLVADFLPAGIGLYRPDHPAIYDTLARQATSGSLCELPMGLRDGFGETGRMDMRTLWYQTIHGRPITGGFVARLDPRLALAYQQAPVIGTFLRLSSGASLSGEQLPSPETAARLLRGEGIGFLMLNREDAPRDLVRYVESGVALRAIAAEGTRTLYEVADSAIASSAPPSR